jgi:hypothetical protein
VKFDQLILIGCGGTGSAVAEALARLLAYHKDGCKEIILIDGDKFEEKNQERQMFSPKFMGKNKAEALRERLDFIQKVITVPTYINAVDFQDVILDGIKDVKKKNLLIVMAVDNVATRLDLITALDESKAANFVLIDPGNGLDDGTVETSIKQKGKWITPHPFDKRPEMRNPKDRIPGGCAAEAPSTPQLLVANFGAANQVLQVVQALLDDQKFCEDLRFECRKLRAGPMGPLLSVDDFVNNMKKKDSKAASAKA